MEFRLAMKRMKMKKGDSGNEGFRFLNTIVLLLHNLHFSVHSNVCIFQMFPLKIPSFVPR